MGRRRLVHLVVTVATVATGATRASAEGDLPEPIPDGRGGFTVTFEAEHLKELQAGQLDGDVFVVPRSADYRPCVFATPPVPVFHGRGFADVSFELEANWVGFLDLQRGEEGDLFTTFVNVKRGADVRRTRDYMHTGLLLKNVDYIAEDGKSHLHATSQGFTTDYEVTDVAVTRDDEITVRVCDVRPGVWFKTRSVTVHTYPSGQEGPNE